MNISLPALEKLKQLVIERESPAALRIKVTSGGCNGLTYGFVWDNNLTENDELLQSDSVIVAIDKKSYIFIKNATLDFNDSLSNAGFYLMNPAAVSLCGCQKSFSI